MGRALLLEMFPLILGRTFSEFLFIGSAKIADILKSAGEGGIFGSYLPGGFQMASGIGQPKVQNIVEYCTAKGFLEVVAKLGDGNSVERCQLRQS